MYVCRDIDGNPVTVSIGLFGWLLAILRIIAIIGVSIIYILVNIILRALIEIPFFSGRRVFSQYVIRLGCAIGLIIFGVKVKKIGKPANKPGFVVSNHSSWLDILMLQLYQNPMYIAKDAIRKWPLVNVMTWIVGTVFVKREPTQAAKQNAILEDYFKAQVAMIFFPEGGTFSFGMQPFKSSLFEVLFNSKHQDTLYVQPVSLFYTPPRGVTEYVYKWGKNHDTSLMCSFAAITGRLRRARGVIVFSDPLKVSDYPDRKALAKAAEEAVQQNLQRYGGGNG